MTKEEIELYEDLKEKISTRLEEILPIFCKIVGVDFCGSISSFEFNLNKIEIETQEHFCGETEKWKYKIPIYSLYDDSWQEKLKKEISERSSSYS